MNEKITVNGESYTVKNVTTGIETISFTLTNPEDDPEAAFRGARELTVKDGKGTAYGHYPDVEYESLTIAADGSVTITMHILTETEKKIRDLQMSQLEQDEAIAEILYGGGEDVE